MAAVILLTVLVMYTCISGVEMHNRILTYNTGLNGLEPKYTERIMPLVQAMKNERAKVICLQQVWNGVDVARISLAVSKNHRYIYSSIHQKNGGLLKGSPCEQSQYKYIRCVQRNKCLQQRNAVKCMIRQCQIFDWSDTCRTCVIMTDRTLEAIVRDCVNPKINFNINGLMLISKRPLEGVVVKDFVPKTAQLVPRSFIQARVKDIGNVVCTQLTAYPFKAYLELNLPYKSWEEQHLAEVKKLIEIGKGKKNMVIMGDLQTGPPRPDDNIDSSFIRSFRAFKAAGYLSEYLHLVNKCTFCKNNPLNEGMDYSVIIDHILTKKHVVADNAKRRFTKNIPNRDYPLSPFYGVEVKLDHL